MKREELTRINFGLVSTRLIPSMMSFGKVALPMLAIYLIAFDTGDIARLLGMSIQVQMFFHNLFHDVRHIAGFMCH